MCQNIKSEKKCAITENVRLKIQGKVEGPQQYTVRKLKD